MEQERKDEDKERYLKMLEELEPWTLEEAMLRKDTSMTVYSTGTARF